MNSKFKTFWHSAFSIEELRSFLELINKVYRQDKLTPDEFMAANDLESVVVDTGHERRIDPVHHVDAKLQLARAISCSINDPLWRECLEKSAVNPPLSCQS